MKYLGVDYGKRYLGLAISDGELASLYKQLEVFGLADALSKVKNIIKKEKVKTVIVGLPESGEAKAITKKFVAELEKVVPVTAISETLTSQNATKLMIKLGIGKRSRKHKDITAACLILQEFLDEKK